MLPVTLYGAVKMEPVTFYAWLHYTVLQPTHSETLEGGLVWRLNRLPVAPEFTRSPPPSPRSSVLGLNTAMGTIYVDEGIYGSRTTDKITTYYYA